MPRECRADRAARALAIHARLDAALPEARIALKYQDELQLLVAVMLSAQCTDAVVNQVTPAVFARYRTAADYAEASERELGALIRRCGLWRSKARNIVAAMRAIADEHGGRLPRTREALEALPGVGRKTAGVVLLHAFDLPAFPVDTHVGRIARRLGLSHQTDPDRVEEDLCALWPPALWGRAHQLLIWHGRRTCKATRPLCAACPVEALCPRLGVDGAPQGRATRRAAGSGLRRAAARARP